jgi:hypothetical protein
VHQQETQKPPPSALSYHVCTFPRCFMAGPQRPPHARGRPARPLHRTQ